MAETGKDARAIKIELPVTVVTPIPKGTRRPELAYQLDEAAEMHQYQPEVTDPWTSCLAGVTFKNAGLG